MNSKEYSLFGISILFHLLVAVTYYLAESLKDVMVCILLFHLTLFLPLTMSLCHTLSQGEDKNVKENEIVYS